jgi:hypothetical protein
MIGSVLHAIAWPCLYPECAYMTPCLYRASTVQDQVLCDRSAPLAPPLSLLAQWRCPTCRDSFVSV